MGFVGTLAFPASAQRHRRDVAEKRKEKKVLKKYNECKHFQNSNSSALSKLAKG